MKNKDKLYKFEDDIENHDTLENGWWYYTGLSNDAIVTSKRRLRTCAHLNKQDPRLCTKCNYVWAREYDSDTKITASILLPDFPKYGLKKQICYFCKNT